MTQGVSIMEKILKSKITKSIGIVLAFLGMAILSSFTTRSSLEEQFADFTEMQFEKSVQRVMDKTVTPQLSTLIISVDRIETKVDAQGMAIVSEIIRQIEKNYEKYQKGDFADISETNLKYVSDNWILVPEEKRTDILKKEYAVIIDYYVKIKK